MANGASLAPSSWAAFAGSTTSSAKFSPLRVGFSPKRRIRALIVAAQLRPSPAESARTLMEVCSEGTLSTLSSDGWPIGSTVQFALDVNGSPVFCLRPPTLHAKNLGDDSRSSLHAQLDQNGRRAQCTLKGRISRAEKSKLDTVWERRFGEDCPEEHDLFTMNVEEVFQCQDLSEEEVWVSGVDYTGATSDPLKDYAPRIVEDMNKKNWEDILRFCRVYAHLEAEVEQASLTWVDRLGFDMRVLTRSPPRIMEIRIPFEREALDERDARSLLTMMGQVAWEKERKVAIPVAK
ncbi:glutamyl-tRNA reductase-binding protein, chloroplastic [Selaginella moellendorffii]|nr:glutamyl-tRNA reductase-binding protein, chloroplastic [Selaginella moellendorffii]|eukprot:XP_002973412.2 glutamyl-tRNA reductase-binding protein, chloroplastic [Selaginella moellendorffii]